MTSLHDLLDEIQKRVEDAKLSSDDHGHDCWALREYCEHELIYAYDTTVPLLLALLWRAVKGLKQGCCCSDESWTGERILCDECIALKDLEEMAASKK